MEMIWPVEVLITTTPAEPLLSTPPTRRLS
jgi:hypothetical protein